MSSPPPSVARVLERTNVELAVHKERQVNLLSLPGGFAVPINMARRVMDQIVEHGHVRRGRIGVSIKDMTPGAVATSTETIEGAVIADVSRGSPAELVGIQKGDIIVAANGTPIRSAAQLGNKISLTRVGEHLQLTLRRKGAVRDVSVEVAPAAETTGKVYSSRQQ
jgi:serine protease Do